MKLRILKNSKVLISKKAIVFVKFQPKILKYEILFENSKVFFLKKQLWVNFILFSKT